MSQRGRDVFRRVAPVLDAAGLIASRLPGPARRGLWSVSRPLTGRAGLGVRYALARANGAQLGENVSIHSQAVVLHPQGLRTGRNVSVHPLCYIDATGGITIGDDVSIAHMVTIMSTSHRFHRTDIPIKDQSVDLLPTTIGGDVWIGAQAVVVGGVRVGSHSVIGANAVVTRDVPEWSVVAGVPARVIGSRRP